MYMMFVLVDKKYYNNNSMGIRGNLNELHQRSFEITQEIFKENPRSIVETKIMIYI